jgi:hypothetical protein
MRELTNVLAAMLLLAALAGIGCASKTAVVRDAPTTAGTAPCSTTAASPFIEVRRGPT